MTATKNVSLCLHLYLSLSLCENLQVVNPKTNVCVCTDNVKPRSCTAVRVLYLNVTTLQLYIEHVIFMYWLNH